MIGRFPNPIAKSKTLSDSKSRGKSSDRGRILNLETVDRFS